ncbi:MAG: SH3 domain-containing protein, partial [Saprospiraceae bacterium]|nr:SH3 domain-containing protein [Saprospiraceae bacterium]
MNLQTYTSQKQKSCKATYKPTHNCSTFAFAPTHNDRPLQSKINLKAFLLLLTILIIGLTSYSQSYLGTISKQVNLREGPGTDYQVITSLKPKTQIFIVSLETEDDFYSVIDIA